jgi:PIN domain nuclease of toxin-antitoxin system
VRLLLDTHILLWMLAGSDRLGQDARGLIDDSVNEIIASTISIWEVSIKWSLRRGAATDMPLSGRDFAAELLEAGVPILDSTPAHATALDELPLLHGDPFDRLLLATARAEGMTLLTRDTALSSYGAGVRLI